MTTNLILRFAWRTENILGIYRNYSSISKKLRILVWTGITIEMMSYVYLIHDRISHPQTLDHTYNTIFMCNNILTSLATLITSAVTCTKFKLLLENIEASDGHISNDTTYHDNMKRQYKKIKFTFAFIFFLACSQFKFSLDRIDRVKRVDFRNVVHTLTMFLCNIRFLIEFIVLHCVLFILSEQVKYITRNIVKQNVIPKRRIEIIGDVTQRDIDFAQFSGLLMKVKESSKLINATFGVQITSFLALLVMYAIICLYKVVYLSAFEYFSGYSFINVFIYYTRIPVFLFAIYTLSKSAQTVKNSANDLRCLLARILIKSVDNKRYYNEVKGFLRIVSNPPLKTQAFGSIEVDMTLLPNFIMFIVSYTVIALQYKNLF